MTIVVAGVKFIMTVVVKTLIVFATLVLISSLFAAFVAR